MGVGQNGICAVLSRLQATRTAYATTAYICRSVPLASDQNGICHNGKKLFWEPFCTFWELSNVSNGDFLAVLAYAVLSHPLWDRTANARSDYYTIGGRSFGSFAVSAKRGVRQNGNWTISEYYTIGGRTISECKLFVDHF